MRTLLVGNFGAHNIGDELILLAALKTYPTATVMTADSAWTQTFCERQLDTLDFPPTGLRSWGRYATDRAYRQQVGGLRNRFDKIVFVGGGLFAIRLRACWLWWQVFRHLKQLNPYAEISFEHQGVDQQLGCVGRWLMRWVLSRANFVSVRDEASLKALKTAGIPEVKLVSDRFWETDLGWQTSGQKDALILVNALKAIPEASLKHLVSQNPQGLVFVAFQKSDLACVPKHWSGRVEFPATASDLFGLFDSAEQAIGERLHFLLTGSKILGPEKVKLLRAPYSEKVATFQKTLGWKGL